MIGTHRTRPEPAGADGADQVPYVVLSCCMSLDGYLDDMSEERLLLSNRADFDRVDAVRAQCDAILVGARTVRRDDPRLLVRSPERRRQRAARGQPVSPKKVTVTSGGDLDPTSRFFALGEVDKLVYCASSAVLATQAHLGSVATVVDAGEPVDFGRVVTDLGTRGVRRLLIEGGGEVHTQVLTRGLADELQLAVAPCFVGDSRAPRFVRDGGFPWCPEHRATLAEVRRLGDVVLLRYALSDRFDDGGDAD